MNFPQVRDMMTKNLDAYAAIGQSFRELLIDRRLRNRRGCRARTVQQRKCKQQAHSCRQLPVAGLRWSRVGGEAA